MIWCFLITILRNLGCQLFQNHLGHECVLLICIVFYSISIMFNRPMCWTPELAELQFCCFLQCVRYHFCIWVASILVASKFSFSQNAVFCYELWATPSQNLRFLKILLWCTCQGASGKQNGDQKWCQNDRLGNHIGAENGENHYGAIFMGQCTGGLALGAKAKGSGTGREQRRLALWGESSGPPPCREQKIQEFIEY